MTVPGTASEVEEPDVYKRQGYDMDMAQKISIQLLATDTNLRPKERIVRKSEKIGLYNALDIGSIWLDRALSGTM